MPQEILYGGQRLFLKNDVIIQGVTEFNTGVRQGGATNDDRTLASFITLEDARGGTGRRKADIREEIDQHLDNGGLIGFQFTQLLVPPKTKTTTFETWYSEASPPNQVVTLESDIDGTMRIYHLFGRKVLSSNGASPGIPATLEDSVFTDDGHHITDVIDYIGPVTGNRHLVVGTDAAVPFEWWDGAAGTFTAHASLQFQTFIEFDGKLWAGGPGDLQWSIDPAGAWNTAAGNWPQNWRFIGVFPFGQTFMPYAIINFGEGPRAKLAVIDVDNLSVIPLNLGVGGVVAAAPIGGEIGIIAASGKDVFIYDPENRKARDLDWRAQERNGFRLDSTAISIIDHPRGPVIIADVDDGGTAKVQFFLHRGTGWHSYGRAMAGTAIAGGAYLPQINHLWNYTDGGSSTYPGRYLPWWDEAYSPGVVTSIDMEDQETLELLTPWYDGGFSNIDGTLLTLQCGGFFNSKNKIHIEYQLNLDEVTAWTSLGTYPNTGVPSDPEISTRADPVEAEGTLVFNATDLRGKEFTWIRFKIRLEVINDAGGQLIAHTPNAFPLTLRFFKRPQLRDSFRMEIDVNETLLGPDRAESVKDLITNLRAIYNQLEIPKLIVGNQTTWAAMTSYPRIPHYQERPGGGEFGQYEIPEDAIIVITAAELL